MARRVYTDADRARLYAALVANDGNIARAARDAGIPENTARDWTRQMRQEAETHGMTTDLVVPESALPVARMEAQQLVRELEEIVVLGLAKCKELLPLIDDPKHLSVVNTIMGTAIDKLIRLGAGGGGGSEAPPKDEAPDAGKIAKTVVDLVDGALQSALAREREIVDAEFVEQADDGEDEGTPLALVAG